MDDPTQTATTAAQVCAHVSTLSGCAPDQWTQGYDVVLMWLTNLGPEEFWLLMAKVVGGVLLLIVMIVLSIWTAHVAVGGARGAV